MKFKLTLLESNDEIQSRILTALLSECRYFMTKALVTIQKELLQIVYLAITNRPEYNSLISGNLRLQFGIPDANVKVANIINHWMSNVVYNYQKPVIQGNKIKSYISAELIKSDFSDVLGTSDAVVTDALRGYDLPWLEWLLLDGRKVIVPKHSVVIGPNPRSRTGEAVMRISSSSWKVPSEFSGTIADNWITRAIDDAGGFIEDLLQRAFDQ